MQQTEKGLAFRQSELDPKPLNADTRTFPRTTPDFRVITNQEARGGRD